MNIINTISTFASHAAPTATVFTGMGTAMEGIGDIAKGAFRKGVQKLFCGLTVVNLVSRSMNISRTLHSESIKWSLLTGIAISAFSNIAGLPRDVLRVVGASIALSYLTEIDSKIFAVAHETLTLMLASGYIACLGAKHLSRCHYAKGSFEILLGAVGIAFALHHISNELVIEPDIERPLPIELKSFLKKHEPEITYLRKTQQTTGQWNELGKGSSKITFEHPDLDNYIIKIHLPGYWQRDSATSHLTYLNQAKEILKEQHHQFIAIPDSYLLKTAQGHDFIVETKFKPDVCENPSSKTIVTEFEATLRKLDLCDIELPSEHNAFWIKDPSHPGGPQKIALFDFDCQMTPVATSIAAASIGSIVMLSNKLKSVIAAVGIAAAASGTAYYATSTTDPMAPILSLFYGSWIGIPAVIGAIAIAKILAFLTRLSKIPPSDSIPLICVGLASFFIMHWLYRAARGGTW